MLVCDLKNCILAHIKASHKGRDALLAFDDDLGPALQKPCSDDSNGEAVCLARAAKIVPRDMLKLQADFTGLFDQDCQVKSVPQSLLSSVDMIHNGPSIISQTMSQATFSLAQLLQ